MAKLDLIFDKQRKLQEKLGYDLDNMDDLQRTMYIKEYTQHADHEMHEMLAEVPYFKAWKKYGQNLDSRQDQWNRAKCEFVDAFHFIINVAIALGFDADMLAAAYIDKNNINLERQEDKENYKPCVDSGIQTTEKASDFLVNLSLDTALVGSSDGGSTCV